MKRPTKISSRPRPIRLKDAPGRIVPAKDDAARPNSISFSLEEYLVPEGGGEVKEFRKPTKR